MGEKGRNGSLRFDRPEGVERECDAPGCTGAGLFRAPQSRDQLTSYYWFCAEHVRSYNAAWNYYAGMNEADIEAHLRADTTWHRPTWPLGCRAARRRRYHGYDVHDAFGVYRQATRQGGESRREAPEHPRSAAVTEHHKALSVLNLSSPTSLDAIKARYRELVKRHHPDANGGDKAAEERLKSITQAYRVLRGAFRF